MRSIKVVLTISLAVLVARVIYVVMEASYNGAIIDMMATPLLTATQASVVEQLGHKLAALGLALLVTPLAVRYAVKGIKSTRNKVAGGILAASIVFLAIFSSAFHAQAFLMEKLVKSSSPEVRYEAYYSVLFRQLYVEGAIVDQEFALSTDTGSLMLAMPFAWSTEADLGRLLRQNGEGLVLERAQKQAVLERFEADYDAYRDYQALTGEFIEAHRSVSKEALAKVNEDTYSAASLYGEVVESLYHGYPAYQALNEKFREHTQFLRTRNWLYGDIKDLFQASRNEQAWRHRVLLKKAGLEDSGLTPDDWCDRTCPGSFSAVKSTLQEALEQHYRSILSNVPMGLSLKRFLTSHHAINAAMERGSVLGTGPFDGSPVTFERFKAVVSQLPVGPDVSSQISKRFPQVDGVYLPAGMSGHQLVESQLFETIASRMVGPQMASFEVDLTKGEFFEAWTRKSEQVIRASQDILLPESPAQMLDDEVLDAGLAAVKMLYIPAIAAIVSAVMCAVSVLSIVAMFVSFFGKPRLTGVVVLVSVIVLMSTTLLHRGMPSTSMESSWTGFASSSPVAGQMWELFFGLEKAVLWATDDGERVIAPETSNQLLNVGLGWAL